jgi:hypothetical protein
MKALWMLWLAVLAFGLVPAGQGAALSNADRVAARDQGTNSLARFQRLITPANFQLMGFSSTVEVPSATNAEPLLVYTVPLNRLTNYQAASALSLLIVPDPQTDPAPVAKLILPVMVGTDVRSSLILRRLPTLPGQPVGWANAGWGKPRLIRDLMITYAAVPNADLRTGTKSRSSTFGWSGI